MFHARLCTPLRKLAIIAGHERHEQMSSSDYTATRIKASGGELNFGINSILGPSVKSVPDSYRASMRFDGVATVDDHLRGRSPCGGVPPRLLFLPLHHQLVPSSGFMGHMGVPTKAPDANNKRPGHPYQSRMPARRKKPRTSFTKPQLGLLESRFANQKYLASGERAELARQLKMSDAQVKTWFQNRRTKWRRQEAEEREFRNKEAVKLVAAMGSSLAACDLWHH